MNVIIAGSRSLGRGQAPRLLIRFLAALPEDAVLFLRRPGNEAMQPGPFELDTAAMASLLHLTIQWFPPIPTMDQVGRTSVYIRDITMAERADLGLLFFAEGEEAHGYSGTAHLMDKLLAAGRPTYAYGVTAKGSVYRVGEYDPEHLYADLAPSA